MSLLTGEPDYLDPLGAEAPVGWTVTGYPWYSIDTPANKKFVADYRAKYHDYPRLGSVVGYSAMMSLANGLKKAGSTDPDKFARSVQGACRRYAVRPDHVPRAGQPVDDGRLRGRDGAEDGKGVMTSFRYIDGASVQPPDAEVKKLRPAD